MSNETITNGLTLLRISSQVEPPDPPFTIVLEDFEKTVSKYVQRPSFFVAYLDYTVIIGRYDNEFVVYQEGKDETLDPTYLQRIRIFNKDEELLLWRSGGKLKGRIRRDYEEGNEKGDTVEVVEANQVLFGTRAEEVDKGFTKISEKRGTNLILPFPIQNIQVDDKQQRIFIKTRNYIDYNTVHQATYVDCRFVGFIEKKGDNSKDLM